MQNPLIMIGLWVSLFSHVIGQFLISILACVRGQTKVLARFINWLPRHRYADQNIRTHLFMGHKMIATFGTLTNLLHQYIMIVMFS